MMRFYFEKSGSDFVKIAHYRLPIILEIPPQLGPVRTWSTAHEYVWMADGLLVCDTVTVRDLTGQVACVKFRIRHTPGKPENNDHIGRRISVATIPVGIDPTDGWRQAVLRT